jgi:hypothetical protein
MSCSVEADPQDPLPRYHTMPTSLGLPNLGKDNAKEFAYCGGGLQSLNGTKEHRQHEDLRESRQKASSSRRHKAQPYSIQRAKPTIGRDSSSGNSLSQRPLFLPSAESPHQPPALSLVNDPLPSLQQSHLASLPFPNYAQSSNTRKFRTYQPPPVTDCYQLDRFLDEIPDFRGASLSDKQNFVNPRLQGVERSSKHRHALAVRLRSLQGSIEGF